MKNLVLYSMAALIVVSSLFAGGGAESKTSVVEYPLGIVVTTGMVGDIVSQVVGTNGSVFVLMDDEIDPHLFRSTRADIARMQQADLIFYNGFNLEGQMSDTLVQLARSRPVFAVTELIEESMLLDVTHTARKNNPASTRTTPPASKWWVALASGGFRKPKRKSLCQMGTHKLR